MKKLLCLVLAICLLPLVAMAGSADVLNTESELPIVKEPITLSIFGKQGAIHADWPTMDFFKEYQKMTGITLDFQQVPSQGYDENKGLMFASPDMGGSKRAGMYAKTLNNSFVICYKHRNKPNEIGEMRLIGDVKGKHVILLDDIIDTGSTICKAAGIIMENGAKSVRAMITHPVLSGNAIEKVENSALEELVTTDTIPLKRESSKIHVLSCDWLLAEAIRRVVNYESLDNLYETTIHRKGVIHRM